MKLIEKGNWQNPWSMETVCTEEDCGAKILVEEKDVKPVDYQNDYYTECMICGQKIIILEKCLPQRMKNVLDKKRKHRDSDWR